MPGKVEEDISHRFRSLLVVHIIKLAVIGAGIDDDIVPVLVLDLCYRVHFFQEAGWELYLDLGLVPGHTIGLFLPVFNMAGGPAPPAVRP
jgi:hypothetical protein